MNINWKVILSLLIVAIVTTSLIFLATSSSQPQGINESTYKQKADDIANAFNPDAKLIGVFCDHYYIHQNYTIGNTLEWWYAYYVGYNETIQENEYYLVWFFEDGDYREEQRWTHDDIDSEQLTWSINSVEAGEIALNNETILNYLDSGNTKVWDYRLVRSDSYSNQTVWRITWVGNEDPIICVIDANSGSILGIETNTP